MSEVETLRAHGTHVRGVRERLRLVFGAEPPLCDAGPVPPALPWVEFMAFTEDSRVSGHIQLDCDRLSDTLNTHRDFLLCDVRVECLEDGCSVQSAEVPIARDELIAVLAGDPRGDPARRIHTLTHPVTVEAGPYLIRGYLHALPGMEPLAWAHRRRPMIPLSDAWIEYRSGGVRQVTSFGTIVVNRDTADWMQLGFIGPRVVPDTDMTAVPIATRITNAGGRSPT
jgi:hypothetical protein